MQINTINKTYFGSTRALGNKKTTLFWEFILFNFHMRCGFTFNNTLYGSIVCCWIVSGICVWAITIGYYLCCHRDGQSWRLSHRSIATVQYTLPNSVLDKLICFAFICLEYYSKLMHFNQLSHVPFPDLNCAKSFKLRFAIQDITLYVTMDLKCK